MSMKSLEEAFQLIEANKDKGSFSGPKDDDLINKAENILGIQFPPTYRLFLQKYGSGGVGFSEINGIVDADIGKPFGPDCVWCTLEERKMAGFPLSFIVISSLGEGSEYCIDVSDSDKNNESPVYLCGLDDPDMNKEKVAEDFGEFLLEQTKQALED